MRIRYCSADVCSSDLVAPRGARRRVHDVNSGANPNILCLGVAFSIYSRPQGLAPRADRRRKDGPGMTGAVQAYPALVLNADFRPLSYFPLSLWSWQDAITAVFLDRVNNRSEERRGGKACVRTCRSRWSPYP